jgi:predicted ATPase
VPVVVGREAELEATSAFLDRMASVPAALVLDGKAGIGKTVLWREAVAQAESRGVRVLRALPAESEAELSYAALSDLVGGVFDEFASRLPAVQEAALAAALLRSEPAVPADRRLIATGLLGVLELLAAAGPVVVAVDDVQWLDRATAGALEFAIRRLPADAGVLVARRWDGGEELPLGLAHAFSMAVERVLLGPLGLAALFQVLRQELGSAPSRPVLARIAAASGGNPFYALELARALPDKGGTGGGEGSIPVPELLQGLVLGRVRALSAAAQRVALVIAALSRPGLSTVAAALGSEAVAEAAILEAEQAGVVVADGELLRLAHPLLASAVYASGSHEQRRQLHRRLASIVSDPEEQARHLALSERGKNAPAAIAGRGSGRSSGASRQPRCRRRAVCRRGTADAGR